ncbi:hypothetical protein Misp01_32580 [Microtetraspora sp. NBRC 13810]|uniref:YybH family protein n=1 Tax=Microtetraspora sp. NBRC 13810 TaxID=3030990 RepID=UPI0024A0A6D1|nr:SgcJ/EcaC family oxidoreductase [Microtetraspora sp. NBRC 13810]GLW08128.1 hypothetical protein Misp01_32580 [Microtetraspora sp. NBRC 13810]
MSDDREQIRDLIERWAAAVRRADLDGVLADRSADIVMFDVPPPADGVRGIDAYRDAWPPFLAWQAGGAVFEIVSLDVTAGEDAAFAHALLRCGTPDDLARDPGARLRLTFGLRRQDGRWFVTHEHHSFPITSGPRDTAAEEGAVRAVHEVWSDRTAAKDLEGLLRDIAPDVVSYEHETPLAYVGRDEVREVCRRGLESTGGAVHLDVPDLSVRVGGDIAVAWGINHVRAEGPDGETVETRSRGTRVFQKRDGAWLMIHQHLSFPLDPMTGKAATDLRP